ncbi:unnamed protein product, partial [Closterium sp. NIES-53]
MTVSEYTTSSAARRRARSRTRQVKAAAPEVESMERNGKRAPIGNSPSSDFRGVVGKVCGVGVKVLLELAVAGSGVVINALLVLVAQLLAQVLLEIGAVGADGGLRALRIVDIRCEGGRITRGRGLGARVGGDRSSGSGGGHGLKSTTFPEDNRAKVVAADHNRGEENLDRVSVGVPISSSVVEQQLECIN